MTPPDNSIILTLSRQDMFFVLEALQLLENKWVEINRTTTDEDEQADYGNDALALHSARESIEAQAVEVFGPEITNFSREPIPTTPPKASGF